MSHFDITKTSGLNVGDIVHVHGMEVLLDREPIEFNSGHGPARSFSGRVLNEWDLDDPFLLRHIHYWGSTGEYQDVPRWTVQGNDRASWAVHNDADAVDTDTCPEHGLVMVVDYTGTAGPDPYAVNVLACGHSVACFGPGEPNVIVATRVGAR